ncbi:MAG: adenylyl-sulfate kinase [Planctomycetes bacterium]|nr:adenylyl-sulfate kinase [Planctomycetota bacterium]
MTLDRFVASYMGRSRLRFTTMGSVDDGKSTLIGRLLHDSGNLPTDQWPALESGEELDLSRVTDGLSSEREQGITIDVAYRYFSTPHRNFIVADAPGHVRYTRNMATAASTAQLALLVVDARKGVTTQTRRHAFIAALLGVRRFLICANKMDLVDYAESPFRAVVDSFSEFAARLGGVDLEFVPVSALRGDNVVEPSRRMPWYTRDTVLGQLEHVFVESDRNLVDFRFPVQGVARTPEFRGYTGQIPSGRIRRGEEIVVLPAREHARVVRIATADGDLDEAFAPQSVTIALDREIDIGRGDMIARPGNLPWVTDRFEAMVVTLAEGGIDATRPYGIQVGTQAGRVTFSVRYAIDVDTLRRRPSDALELNDIARVALRSTRNLFLDPYELNRAAGGFILFDEESFATVAAGMVIPRRSEDDLGPVESTSASADDRSADDVRRRCGVTLWLTGLSGAGKSTIAEALERRLVASGRAVVRLDGDRLREGLARDLGFSADDRRENIRRAAEVARLLNDSGVLVVAALISPYEEERRRARSIVGDERFVEIHVDAPLSLCEERDPKGLYGRARRGEIERFTGLTDPYEIPERPDLRLDTARSTVDECVDALEREIRSRVG